ncbi:hypothetical protein GCM10010412_032940 [Nonomuraea recticatena]|uniref:Uncharacterized protein n=1 Tax=Nonomuraea recticatena TaxID=46178 RepID=A0ABN3RTI7_9ACTN
MVDEETRTPPRTNDGVVASNKITASEGTHVIIWLGGAFGAGNDVTVDGPFGRWPGLRGTQAVLAAVSVSEAW